MPVLGFGTLTPDAAVTVSATRDALEVGFRHLVVALHQMLTAVLPFVAADIAADPLEWVHCHIARQHIAPVIAAQSQNRCLPSP